MRTATAQPDVMASRERLVRLTAQLLIALAFATACRAQARIAIDSPLTGSFKNGDDAGCALQSQALSRDSVRLQLSCVTGPPAYNLGFVEARLRVVDGLAVYVAAENGATCRIEFRFRGPSVEISQREERVGCGFGARVSATGVVDRFSSSPPPFDLAPWGRGAPP
jgi:hypothetical protein